MSRMGISSPAIGIHGTDDRSSIRTAASHGCIRLSIDEAEWLFEEARLAAVPSATIDRPHDRRLLATGRGERRLTNHRPAATVHGVLASNGQDYAHTAWLRHGGVSGQGGGPGVGAAAERTRERVRAVAAVRSTAFQFAPGDGPTSFVSGLCAEWFLDQAGSSFTLGDQVSSFGHATVALRGSVRWRFV